MGIAVEFNPDLALRNISEFKNGKCKAIKIIPEGEIYFNSFGIVGNK